ncbi:MAG: Gldg family protein [Cytophagales bacterium]|nr:Gldg family protein [Cytophagales bacterium]
MRLITNIAKHEIRRLFCSPIIWLVLIAFVLQILYGFFDRLEYISISVAKGWRIHHTSDAIFGSNFPAKIGYILVHNIYIYIPLITMGLFSKEYNTGSFRLLISSPAYFWQLVMGKYLALIVYSLLLCLVLAALLIYCLIIIDGFYPPFVISAIFGYFLLLTTYSAIGLFISSLTSKQVIAAITTFAVIGLFSAIGAIGQDIPFLNSILYWVSISGRVSGIMAGLIGSKDIMYFLLITCCFVAATIFKLSLKARTQTWSQTLVRFTAFAVVIIAVAMLSNNPYYRYYWDVTERKRATISAQSQAVTAQLRDSSLVMNSYVNIFSEITRVTRLSGAVNNDIRYFENFVRFLPQLQFNHVFFYDTIPSNPKIYQQNRGLDERQLAANVASSYRLRLDRIAAPAAIRTLVDLSAEGNEFIRVISTNSQSSFLRMFLDSKKYPGQKHIASSLKSLIMKPPLVGYVKGHGERSCLERKDGDYTLMTDRSIRSSLINHAFQFKEVDLGSTSQLQEVDILVIADPKVEYTADELKVLAQYIRSGKNLLILLEAERSDKTTSLLAMLGLTSGGTLTSVNTVYEPSIVFTDITDAVTGFSEDGYFTSSLSIEKRYPVVLPGATALTVKDSALFELDRFPILTTRKHTVLTTDSASVMADSIFTAGYGLTRMVNGKEQRMAVIGDADFLSEIFLSSRIQKGNVFLFAQPLFSWLNYDRFPAVITYPSHRPKTLYLSTDQVRSTRLRTMIALPLLILMSGAFVLIRRKRK